MIDVRVWEHGRIVHYTIHNTEELICLSNGTHKVIPADYTPIARPEPTKNPGSPFVLLQQNQLTTVIVYTLFVTAYLTAFIMMCLK